MHMKFLYFYGPEVLTLGAVIDWIQYKGSYVKKWLRIGSRNEARMILPKNMSGLVLPIYLLSLVDVIN